MRFQRRGEAAARAQERREREDTAARLVTIVPELTSLALEVREFSAEGTTPLLSYRKLVIVERAPALFEIRCRDKDCDGEYNLTAEIMAALREHALDFSGEDRCRGQRRKDACARRLHYRALATYQDP